MIKDNGCANVSLDEIDMEVQNLGALPLAKAIFDGMKLRELVDRHLGSDSRQKLTHGQVITLLACNLLLSPTTLYKVVEWAWFSGISSIYGIDPETLNDDRLVRALDAIHPHINTMKSELALYAAERYDIPLDKIHWDFTHFLFAGEYDNQSSDFAEIVYTKFSLKDPPEKAMKACLGVTVVEGTPVPVYYDVMKGSDNQKQSTFRHMQKMKKHLKKDNLLFVTDRGCFSGDVVSAVVDDGFDLISAIAMDGPIRRKYLKCLSSGEGFTRLSYLSEKQRSNEKKGREVDYYWGFEAPHNVTAARKKQSYAVRLIYVKSDGKLKRDLKSRQKKLKKLEDAEQKLRSKLGKVRYRTEEEVEKRIASSTKGNPMVEYLSWSIGRDDSGNLTLRWDFDTERMEKEEAVFDGIYAVATTVKKKARSLDEIFSWYKEQNYVEIANKTLKAPVRVRPIYLHKQQRIESLVFVFFLALMGYSLIQYLFRKNATTPKEKKFTTARILWLFHTICVVLCNFDGKTIVKPAKLRPFQEELLKRMGLKLDFG